MQERNALITGATSGIGRAFAGQLAREKQDLILVSRDAEKLDALKNELEGPNGISVLPITADLACPGAARKVHETVQNSGRQVGLLINNAGAGSFGFSTELDPDRIASQLHLNIITLTQLAMLFGRDMQARGAGQILNIASTAAFQPVPLMASYAAGKSYVLNFSEALARELEDYGVTVTCLCPGMTDTGWFGKAGIASKAEGFFNTRKRVDPQTVAAWGLRMLRRKKMTAVHGRGNAFLAGLNRLFPRRMIASISKSMVYKDRPEKD